MEFHVQILVLQNEDSNIKVKPQATEKLNTLETFRKLEK